MKKPASALVAALLLSAGVAYAGEVAKTATAKPAEKPAAEAVKPAETAAPRVASAHVVYERSFPVAGPVGSEGNAAAFSSDSTGRCSSGR